MEAETNGGNSVSTDNVGFGRFFCDDRSDDRAEGAKVDVHVGEFDGSWSDRL